MRTTISESAAAAASGAKAAAPLRVEPPASIDPTKLYKHWVSLDVEVERLLERWGDVEAWLADEHNWLRLTKDEQAALPEGQVLRDVDARLEDLFAERDGLLGKLPTQGARTLDVIAARLWVAERLIYRHDHPEAHAMIAGSRRDLRAIMAGAGSGGL